MKAKQQEYSLSSFKSLVALQKVFKDEMTCRKHLEQILWNDEPICPHCAATGNIYRYNNGKLFKCGDCRKQFTVTVGTIFERSHVPLQKWFMAVWAITTKAKGIASIQLADEIGVQQRTAWFMLQRIRFALNQKSFITEKFSKTSEVDEIYPGPRAHNMHAAKKDKLIKYKNIDVSKTHAAVVGILERKGGFILQVVSYKGVAQKAKELVLKNVEAGSKLMSDGFVIYRGLKKIYKHESVDHSAGEYVRGNAHINSVEGQFGLFRRGLIGVFHHMSPQHLQLYCNEFSYRQTFRAISKPEKFNKALTLINGRLTYRSIINRKPV